jgi:crotonobetainyl-CoA:carnitine CoA-transferase CaiB-like acyl-CoA transferase
VGITEADPMESGPLAGLRVVDFTHVLAGPYCTQLLADAGATVVKVEPPSGEHARSRGAQRRRADGLAVSSFFAAVNRGKLSVAIDLKSVENFAPGTMARLGLDLAEMRARDPGLLTVSISLFGDAETAGPLASRGGLAIVAEAESTVASMTRHHDGTPVTPGIPMGDMASGLAAYAAIVTALVERSRTGRGRHLEISMVRTLWALNSPAAVRAQMPDDGPSTKDLPAGYGVFPAADGFVAIGVNSDSLFTRLASAICRPDLAADPRFAGAAMRDQFADEINAVVAAWTRARAAQSIVEQLSRFDVPAGRVMTPTALLADQEMRAIGLVQTVADGLGGTIDTPSNPMGFSLAGAGIPRLNEHAGQILPEIGMAP